jgi:hypothetical protein
MVPRPTEVYRGGYDPRLFALHYPDEPHLEDVTVALRLPPAYGDSAKEAHATILRPYQSDMRLELTDVVGNGGCGRRRYALLLR